ncbi:MAG: di-trans,poly-cis-decaprenylcistransferase [Legionellales bacterium]|nr:di-trans,poly-cis-decaprenylcistransferase [Legionellales bacterium]|tara:strand:+ start:559 stop:1302 length:744 start_codon:yes stop_codon:yes gene_type:complete
MKATSKITELKHVAIIMDGNGRWAKSRKLPRVAGHRAGVKALRKLIEHLVKIKLNIITVYAFSRENWQRPQSEVDLLMNLFISALHSEVNDIHENNVKLNFIGDRSTFSGQLQDSINDSELLTSSNNGLCLNIAANYSGRWDIVQAYHSIAKDIESKLMSIEDVDETTISNKLSLADHKDPDLFIRTGGEQRISNYLLWETAYTELYFTETLWPDFDAKQFDIAIDWYSKRQRRFGKTSEQIEKTQN